MKELDKSTRELIQAISKKRAALWEAYGTQHVVVWIDGSIEEARSFARKAKLQLSFGLISSTDPKLKKWRLPAKARNFTVLARRKMVVALLKDLIAAKIGELEKACKEKIGPRRRRKR